MEDGAVDGEIWLGKMNVDFERRHAGKRFLLRSTADASLTAEQAQSYRIPIFTYEYLPNGYMYIGWRLTRMLAPRRSCGRNCQVLNTVDLSEIDRHQVRFFLTYCQDGGLHSLEDIPWPLFLFSSGVDGWLRCTFAAVECGSVVVWARLMLCDDLQAPQ